MWIIPELQGSCHSGQLKITARDVDLAILGKCNRSYCHRVGKYVFTFSLPPLLRLNLMRESRLCLLSKKSSDVVFHQIPVTISSVASIPSIKV